MKLIGAIAAAAVSLALGGTAGAQGVDKMYVLDCGQGHAADQSRWSPGVNVGVPRDIADNCYLIHHPQGYFLWDSGVDEAVANMPDGQVGGGGSLVWRRPITIAAQLAKIGVKPSDVRWVAVSHTHPDHVGNVDMFPNATLLIQEAEYDWAFMQNPPPRFSKNHPVMKLKGDHDVFGDGAVTIISTPGHTPGHESLLVHLQKTGWLVLSGDATHFKENWDNRRVPGFNFDKEKTVTSMDRIADLLKQRNAQLWINHDKVQSDAMRRPPEYYD